jgi:hypothetical protein
MNFLAKSALALQAIWMLLALAGGLIILGDSLGYAAWNGVNFVMVIYLVLALAGSMGLVAALTRSTSRKPLFTWIGGLSAFAIACVALVFLLGFLFRRDSSLPLNEEAAMFGIHAPLVAFYGFSICSCSIQTLLSIFKYRQLKTLR